MPLGILLAMTGGVQAANRHYCKHRRMDSAWEPHARCVTCAPRISSQPSRFPPACSVGGTRGVPSWLSCNDLPAERACVAIVVAGVICVWFIAVPWMPKRADSGWSDGMS